MRLTLLLTLVVNIQSVSALAADVVELRFDDFDRWREPHGDWTIAGKAFVDSDIPERIAWETGKGVAVNGETGRTVHLISKEEYGDVRVHVEFMVPEGSNSGVYLQGRYEIQVLDSWGVEDLKHSDCGGIYQRWRDEPGVSDDERGYEGRPPRVNASKKPGEWQTFEILFRAPRFNIRGEKTSNARFIRVIHNGVVIHENEELSGPTRAAKWSDEKSAGPLMLQGDHGPVAYRNVRIEPLHLDD